MSLSFTDAAMTYLGHQIGANNKVPAGQSFLIAIAIMEAEGDDALFLITGTYSNGAVSNLSKNFSEITAAAGNSKVIVLKLTSGSDYYYLPCIKITSSEIVFADDVENNIKVSLSSSNVVTVSNVEREKDVFWVDGVLNLATMTVSNLTKTYAEIVSAFQNNKNVKNRFFYYLSPDNSQTATGDLRIVDTNNGFVNFDALMLADLDGTNRLYHLLMVMDSSNAIRIEIRVVSSTQIGA